LGGAFAVARFPRWSDARGIALAQLTPVIMAASSEEHIRELPRTTRLYDRIRDTISLNEGTCPAVSGIGPILI
jgi:hypothetical protein